MAVVDIVKSRIVKSEHNGKGAKAARMQRNKMVSPPNRFSYFVLFLLLV